MPGCLKEFVDDLFQISVGAATTVKNTVKRALPDWSTRETLGEIKCYLKSDHSNPASNPEIARRYNDTGDCGKHHIAHHLDCMLAKTDLKIKWYQKGIDLHLSSCHGFFSDKKTKAENIVELTHLREKIVGVQNYLRTLNAPCLRRA